MVIISYHFWFSFVYNKIFLTSNCFMLSPFVKIYNSNLFLAASMTTFSWNTCCSDFWFWFLVKLLKRVFVYGNNLLFILISVFFCNIVYSSCRIQADFIKQGYLFKSFFSVIEIIEPALVLVAIPTISLFYFWLLCFLKLYKLTNR